MRNKLTDRDQQTMVRLYRESNLTATVLAEYYEVSPSTITRLLKEAIPAKEYQELVSQKRSLARRKDGPEIGVQQVPLILQSFWTRTEPIQVQEEETEPEIAVSEMALLEESEVEPAPASSSIDTVEEDTEETQTWQDSDGAFASAFAPDVLHDLEEEIPHAPDGEEDLDDYPEDDYDEDYDEDGETSAEAPPQQSDQIFEILSLEELDPPQLCYVVVDRFDELTTRPLKDFMPMATVEVERSGISEEIASQAKTLPIFDNQRVARRFSQMNRRGNHPNQRNRVIQFPGYLLDIVRSQLRNKGITHVLVDGQVYSL